MRKILCCIFFVVSIFTGLSAQNTEDTVRSIIVFVHTDPSTTTPLNALRAELTNELVNSADSSFVVNDRTDEIWTFLRQEFDYQDLGFVRDDQMIIIGEHFGANYLCVVNVTSYQEFGQYFFEGTVVDINSRRVVKHSYYPQGDNTVEKLDPQTQIKVGKDIARQLGFIEKSQTSTQAQSASAATTVITRRVIGDILVPYSPTGNKEIGDYYTGPHVFHGEQFESTHGRKFIIGYLDYTGEHGLAYMPTIYDNSWCNKREDTFLGAYIADVEQLLKIYENNDKLKLSGEFWTNEVTKKGKPGNCDDTYRIVDFLTGKTSARKRRANEKVRGLYVIVF